jgi:hypothetical protein
MPLHRLFLFQQLLSEQLDSIAHQLNVLIGVFELIFILGPTVFNFILGGVEVIDANGAYH